MRLEAFSTPKPRILGPLLWSFVDSTGYLRFSRLQTLVVCGHFMGYLDLFCDHKVSKRSSLSPITCDLGRWVWQPEPDCAAAHGKTDA
jgi:hypothetical protein